MTAVLIALACAAVYGAGTALQHRVASEVSPTDTGAGRLLVQLLRRPSWIVGLVLSGVAFLLHVAALGHGSLAVVQPIVVTTIVFAVFVRSALDRTLPDRQEVLWAICTWIGLALFVGSVHSKTSQHVVDDRTALLFLLGGALAAVVAVVAAQRASAPPRRGFLLGVGAGVLYGVAAGLIKMVTSYARIGGGPAHHWSLWLVAPAGLSAFALSQRAFQEARLSVSVPVLNIVDVLVAVAFGCIVFGDRLFTYPLQLVAELLGATLMAVGVWRLVREGERLHEIQVAAGRVDRPPTRLS